VNSPACIVLIIAVALSYKIMIFWIAFAIYILYFFIKNHASESSNYFIKNIKSFVVFFIILVITYVWSMYESIYSNFKNDIGIKQTTNKEDTVINRYKTPESLKNEFDWLNNTINNLNDKITKLEEALSNQVKIEDLQNIDTKVQANQTKIDEAIGLIKTKIK